MQKIQRKLVLFEENFQSRQDVGFLEKIQLLFKASQSFGLLHLLGFHCLVRTACEWSSIQQIQQWNRRPFLGGIFHLADLQETRLLADWMIKLSNLTDTSTTTQSPITITRTTASTSINASATPTTTSPLFQPNILNAKLKLNIFLCIFLDCSNGPSSTASLLTEKAFGTKV